MIARQPRRHPPRRRLSSLLLAGGLLAGGLLAGAAGAAPPRRIVSLNLCADQLVVALADRSQIAGLTRNATSTEMSAVAARTRGLPILRGQAEEIVAINPDLVIGMPARRSPLMTVLKAQDYPTLDLKKGDDYPGIRAAIRDVARAVGHPARGEALIARMDRDLAAIPRGRSGRVAAYYQRRGYLTGTGTLVDDLMRRAGYVNLATKLDRPALSQLGLEEMVAARPDLLIVESATNRVADQGTEMLHHPALAGIPRLALPQAWTVCGGPAYVDAARALAAANAR